MSGPTPQTTEKALALDANASLTAKDRYEAMMILAGEFERANIKMRVALRKIQTNDPEANRQHADEIANAALV